MHGIWKPSLRPNDDLIMGMINFTFRYQEWKTTEHFSVPK